MRILDEKSDQKLDNISLFLTRKEAQHLIGYLEQLLEKGDHSHLMSEDYRKEIMVCIYDPEKLDMFDSRSKKLILEDK